MIVYRITNSLYKDDISGEGAKINGARWNTRGISMLYTSQHISLCSLEMLVHVGLPYINNNFHLLHIFVPDDEPVTEIRLNKLKTNWYEDEAYTNFIGDQFINANQSLMLKVPSAVIHEEFNLLFNPFYSSFKKIKIVKSRAFIYDKRLGSFS